MKSHHMQISLAAAALIFLSANSFGAAISFDLSKTNGTLQTRNLAGTCLPIWNSLNTYKQIKKGLMQSNYRLFRFPNGSLSNGYHWNGKGAYTASDSIWVCDSEAYQPGFMSMTQHRGTSVSNWGFDMSSMITDGDTATYWRSDELITGSLPYFYLELSKSTVVDSIVIVWGDRFARDFSIDFHTLSPCPYPGPFGHSEDKWESQKEMTDNGQPVVTAGLTGNKSTSYVRVGIKKFKGDNKSVEVKEVYLFSQGVQVSKNVKKYNGGGSDNQTYVVAMPTFIGSCVRPGTEYTSGGLAWHFEAFMDYIRSIADSVVPVICVNYSTGTPEEAAAWVHYANAIKHYNIRFWQIGNELDGAWEDGGPVTAGMYAEKFLMFSKAMKKADPTIKILGPLYSNAEFFSKNSGLYDNRSWMQAFIEIVGQREKTDGVKYCDGIDFHSYPYWDYSPAQTRMLDQIDLVYNQSDSLTSWIKASLAEPDSAFVMLSEFNSSTVMSDLLQKSVNGLFVANMYAGLADKFGGRAMSVFWDSYEDGDVGPNTTHGSLSLFNTLDIRYWSSLAKAPSAAYWALFIAQNIWIDPARENTVVPALSNDNSSIRAYGIKTPEDFRALFLNFSPQPATVSCSLSVNGFSRADVVTWGEAQFKWNGSSKAAFAYPNCGPVSRQCAAADLKTVVLPGLSMCVVRYHAPDSSGEPPKFLHLWAFPTTGLSRVLPVCGSAGGRDGLAGIDYSFDSIAGAPHGLRSLDSAFDGPFESFSDSIPLQGLPAGLHKLYVKATSSSGKTSVDSASFSISQSAVLPESVVRGGGGWIVSESRAGGRIVLRCAPAAGSGANGELCGRVFSSNGTCVRELSRKKGGAAVFEWAGETGANAKAAPGVYFLVVSSKKGVVCGTPVVVGR